MMRTSTPSSIPSAPFERPPVGMQSFPSMVISTQHRFAEVSDREFFTTVVALKKLRGLKRCRSWGDFDFAALCCLVVPGNLKKSFVGHFIPWGTTIHWMSQALEERVWMQEAAKPDTMKGAEVSSIIDEHRAAVAAGGDMICGLATYIVRHDKLQAHLDKVR